MNEPDAKTTTRKPARRRNQIDENLKRVYDETAKEPLPDRFTELLERLRQQERN